LLLFSLLVSSWASLSALPLLTTGGTVNMPSFSEPVRVDRAVTPGTTEHHQVLARRVTFREPPDRTGPEWFDENSEEL
jgi:hypothetical protein